MHPVFWPTSFESDESELCVIGVQCAFQQVIARHGHFALAEHGIVCPDCHLFCSLRFDFNKVDAFFNAFQVLLFFLLYSVLLFLPTNRSRAAQPLDLPVPHSIHHLCDSHLKLWRDLRVRGVWRFFDNKLGKASTAIGQRRTAYRPGTRHSTVLCPLVCCVAHVLGRPSHNQRRSTKRRTLIGQEADVIEWHLRVTSALLS